MLLMLGFISSTGGSAVGRPYLAILGRRSVISFRGLPSLNTLSVWGMLDGVLIDRVFH